MMIIQGLIVKRVGHSTESPAVSFAGEHEQEMPEKQKFNCEARNCDAHGREERGYGCADKVTPNGDS